MVTVVDVIGAQAARTTVGHDGCFTVVGLGPGIYTVITAAAGYDPRARTGLVNGAGPVDMGRMVLTAVGAAVLPTPGPATG